MSGMFYDLLSEDIHVLGFSVQCEKKSWMSYCTPPPLLYGRGGGGLTGPQFLEGGCWERGGDFFQGGCNFYIKDKLKSEIFNDKKVFEQKSFSLT